MLTHLEDGRGRAAVVLACRHPRSGTSTQKLPAQRRRPQGPAAARVPLPTASPWTRRGGRGRCPGRSSSSSSPRAAWAGRRASGLQVGGLWAACCIKCTRSLFSGRVEGRGMAPWEWPLGMAPGNGHSNAACAPVCACLCAAGMDQPAPLSRVRELRWSLARGGGGLFTPFEVRQENQPPPSLNRACSSPDFAALPPTDERCACPSAPPPTPRGIPHTTRPAPMLRARVQVSGIALGVLQGMADMQPATDDTGCPLQPLPRVHVAIASPDCLPHIAQVGSYSAAACLPRTVESLAAFQCRGQLAPISRQLPASCSPPARRRCCRSC